MKEVKRNKEIAKKIEDEIADAFNEKDLDDVSEEIDLSSLEREIKKDIPKTKPKNKKRKIKIMPLLIAIVLFFLLIMIVIIILKPRISINGESKMKIPYNSEYSDAGAKAKVLGKDISNKIKTDNQVNTSKVGKYKVDYKVKSLLSAKKSRIVEVVDEVPPTIELEGEEDLILCPNAKFEEPGYKAADEYDGDLTDKVVIDEKDASITYTVKDSSDNSYTISRTLTRKDEEKPEISLNGGTSTIVVLNTSYKEQGFTATDNCSGDITAKVTTSGKVDTSKEGKYEITYTVTDDNNNETKVTRTVTVQKNYPQRTSNFSCGEPGVIYLTFDDGPNQYYTPIILDVLKKHNVKATFFVTKAGPDSLIKREYDEGHLVALHTYTHSYENGATSIYRSPTAYFEDLNLISERVKKITGVESKYLRFPGGSSNTISRRGGYTGIMNRLTYEVEAKGYSYFDWNISSGDAGELDYSQSHDAQVRQEINNVLSRLRTDRGNVVLMHDIKWTTADAIDRIIQGAKDKGFTRFEVVNENVICHQSPNN